MVVLKYLLFASVALAGALIAGMMTGEVPTLKRIHGDEGRGGNQTKVVHFSKDYACPADDKACIFHGMKAYPNSKRKVESVKH